MASDLGPEHEVLAAVGERARPMFAQLEQVAGYRPPTALAEHFVALHKHRLESVPPTLSHLELRREGSRDWLSRFRSGVLDSLQDGVCAAHYHLARVEQIEAEMLRIAASFTPGLGLPKHSCIGGGNSRALTYEYQAFAFAARRTLDYLAVSVGAFFKTEVHSIRGLERAIAGKEPTAVAELVRPLVLEHLARVQDLIPDDKHADRSVRDRLAHWESVSAGVLNIRWTPWGCEILIAGRQDGPNASPPPSAGSSVEPKDVITYHAIGPSLRDQFERVWAFIVGVLEALGLPLRI